MKPWQHGFELEELKTLAAPFKGRYKPFIHGAFGMPKERDIAEALRTNSLAWDDRHDGGPPGAVAIFNLLGSASTHRDFAGRAVRLRAGDLFIRHLVGRPEACAGLVGAMLKRCAERDPMLVECPCWLELFEEDDEAKGVAGELGFRYMATKVMASSDIRGLYFRGSGSEFLERQPAALSAPELLTLACLQPDFLSPAEHQDLLAELQAYEASEPWQQHYSSYNKRQSWTAFALKGFDPEDPGFIIKPAEMSKKWKAENPQRLEAKPALTRAAPAFPKTLAAAARIPGEKERIRFMRLEKGGGQLTRHADNTGGDEGLADGLVCRLHIPLRTSEAVRFYSWDERGRQLELNFAERGLYYLDQRKPHAVTNSDLTLERIHFVVDVKSSPELRQLFDASSASVD